MPAPQNIIDTVRALFSDFTLLVKQEFDLARAEVGEKIEQLQIGVAAIAGGLLIAFVALLVLVQALVVALANIMPPSLASLLVGVLLAVIAFVAVMKGRQNLKAENLAPTRTLNSVRDSADEMAEFYQKETDLKLAAALEHIKNSLAIFIGSVVLFLTVLSAETALMMPDTSQMMFNPR